MHGPPDLRKCVQRRTTASALALVLPFKALSSSSSSPAALLCSPPPVAAQVAHSESDEDATCTRITRGEQHLPASASAPALAPAPVPPPAANHAQSSRGAQVERTWRIDCRRSPPSALAATADIPATETHERCIQGDGPWDDDAHLISAAGKSNAAQVPAEALVSIPDASPLVKQGFAWGRFRVQSLWLIKVIRVWKGFGSGNSRFSIKSESFRVLLRV